MRSIHLLSNRHSANDDWWKRILLLVLKYLLFNSYLLFRENCVVIKLCTDHFVSYLAIWVELVRNINMMNISYASSRERLLWLLSFILLWILMTANSWGLKITIHSFISRIIFMVLILIKCLLIVLLIIIDLARNGVLMIPARSFICKYFQIVESVFVHVKFFGRIVLFYS